MSWVYGHYKYFTLFFLSAEIDFRRQILTSIDVKFDVKGRLIFIRIARIVHVVDDLLNPNKYFSDKFSFHDSRLKTTN